MTRQRLSSAVAHDLDFAGAPAGGLLVRAVVGASRLTSPARIAVGRRAVIEVLRDTLPDAVDSTAVATFALQVPPSLGTASGATAMRLTTVAGRTGDLAIAAEGMAAQFTITTAPGAVDHLLIEPAEVSLAAGQQVDFSARAVDSYGNAYALEGVTVAWHCWPATSSVSVRKAVLVR